MKKTLLLTVALGISSLNGMETNLERALSIPTEAEIIEACTNVNNIINNIHTYTQNEFQEKYEKTFLTSIQMLQKVIHHLEKQTVQADTDTEQGQEDINSK